MAAWEIEKSVGLICYRYNPSGGAERYLDRLARGLAERAWRVILFTSSWQADGDFEIVRVPVIRFCSPLKVLSFALNVQRRVRQVKPLVTLSMERTLEQDIVRAGGGSHRRWLNVRRSYVSRLRAAAIMLDPLHSVLLALERRTFSPARTRFVIANSEMVRRHVSEDYRFPNDRIRVIYNGVELDRFTPSVPGSLSPFRIGFVGSGFERKGLGFAIEALSHLPFHTELLIVGRGEIAPYKRLARRRGVEDRIHYLGSDIDTTEFYKRIHLLVLPTIYDPFANVTLEAMACGLPVVTTALNGASELIEQGRTGFVVDDPRKVEELAAGIRFFMDPERWRIASKEARAVAERFPFERNVSETLELLEEVSKVRSKGR